MQKTISLIGRRNYTLSNGLVLHIPSLKELRGECDEDEMKNFNLISPFISTPTDLMVELYDMGIDFQVFDDDYLFFATMIEKYSGLDYSLVFENTGVCNWKVVTDGKDVYVFDEDNEIIITKEVYLELSEVLRKMYYRVRTHREFCNQRALKMAVKIAKKEYEKTMRDRESSEFDNMILLLVNNSNFKYDFDSVKDLTIYDFLSSFRQIQKSDYVDKITLGGYSGGIDLSKIPQAELDKFIL